MKLVSSGGSAGWQGFTGDKVDFYRWIAARVVDGAGSDLFDGHDGIESIELAIEVDDDDDGDEDGKFGLKNETNVISTADRQSNFLS